MADFTEAALVGLLGGRTGRRGIGPVDAIFWVQYSQGDSCAEAIILEFPQPLCLRSDFVGVEGFDRPRHERVRKCRLHPNFTGEMAQNNC